MLTLVSLRMQTIYALKMRGFVSGLRVCDVMQISMKIQIIVGIWVLVSMRDFMMDFMPGKGEHETGIFCHFYGKSDVRSWRYIHVDVMSHININKFKMVEQRLCS